MEFLHDSAIFYTMRASYRFMSMRATVSPISSFGDRDTPTSTSGSSRWIPAIFGPAGTRRTTLGTCVPTRPITQLTVPVLTCKPVVAWPYSVTVAWLFRALPVFPKSRTSSSVAQKGRCYGTRSGFRVSWTSTTSTIRP